ncbi:MAG TPA: hypothetical protein VJ734_08465, partial [Nitrosospira sp.]|nr:hypothetical protein [Nitrosospira sp.]
DLVMPELPGCPLAVADSALRQAAITFCEQSLAWQSAHPDISITSGVAEYSLAPPEGTVVHTITCATLNGEEIEPVGPLSIPVTHWRSQAGKVRYMLSGPTSVTLMPDPYAAGTLTMIAVLKPSAVSTGIDNNLFNEYREAIVHGALARLMLSPRKPYTNPQLAAYHHQQFAIKTATAGMRAARNNARTPLQTAILRRG